MAVIEIFKLFGSILIDSSEAENSIARVEERAEKTGRTLGETIRTAAKWGAGIAAAAGTALAGLYRVGAGFDDAFDAIAISSGATGEALLGLQEDAVAVFRSIPTEIGTAAAAIADLNTLTGATGEALQTMSMHVLEASRLLGEDGTRNAKLFGQAMQQWQRDAEDGPELLDKLFVITQQTGIGFGELIGQLNSYGSVMQNAGFSTEETAMLMGELNAAGLSWSRISPGLNKSFRDWAAAGKEPREEFARIIEAVKNAETETEALTIAAETFGAQGAQRLTTGIRTGAISLDELTASLDGARGAILATADATDDFPEKWAVFRNRAMEAIEPVASGVFDLAGTVMDRLGPSLESLAVWVAANVPKIQAGLEGAFNAIADAISWIADHAATLKPFTDWVIENSDIVLPALATAITVVLVPALWSLAGAIGGMMAAAAPVTALILGITAAVTGGIYLWREYGDNITEFFITAIERAKEILAKIGVVLGDIPGAMIESVKGAVNSIRDFFTETVPKAFVQGGINIINSFIEGLMEAARKVPLVGNRIADFLGDYLIGESPPKKGPLARIDIGGKRVIEAWADGLLMGLPSIDEAMTIVATTVEDGLSFLDRLEGRWKDAAQSIGDAFESMIVRVGEMWATGEGDWRQILSSFLSAAINQIIAAAVGAMGIAELVSKALANMWNPLGWILIAGLLVSLGAIQRGLSQQLDGISKASRGDNSGIGGTSSGSDPSSRLPSAGRQVSEITGPTRDLLTDLLTPLTSLNTLTGIGERIYSLLDERMPMPGMAMTGAAAGVISGVNVTIERGAIQIAAPSGTRELDDAMVDELAERLARKIAFELRGTGR